MFLKIAVEFFMTIIFRPHFHQAPPQLVAGASNVAQHAPDAGQLTSIGQQSQQATGQTATATSGTAGADAAAAPQQHPSVQTEADIASKVSFMSLHPKHTPAL